ALMSALYGWDGMAYALDEGADVEMDVDGNVVSMLVQLSDLGLTPGKFLLLQFQMATEFEVDTYAGAEFFDFVDLAF
ncbi:MAG: hypothetical protein GWN87_17970, partial [Desulfuromonadales bacterium]|nr:hypothetical protein [Desulfuromonadales bacterium]